MARSPATADPFTAIAEPRRRQLIEVLVHEEMTVNQLGTLLSWNQPMVSKHLRVLREVGLVTERRDGRYRAYRVNVAQLKPVKDWIVRFERYWGDTLNQLDDYLNTLQEKEE